MKSGPLQTELEAFAEFGTRTVVEEIPASPGSKRKLPVFINEFWTAKQRAANALHEISYRACFKPQLPRFFIERLTIPGDIVYDPFLGRGTTAIEAALLGRVPYGCDINPLSKILTLPRLSPPAVEEVEERLGKIKLRGGGAAPEDLLVFYHPKTLKQLTALRTFFLNRLTGLDLLDEWIKMVAINRLTGHSNGFFSVYTLPPNQAVSIKSQRRINEKRKQVPEERDVKRIILKKSKSLLKELDNSHRRALAGVKDKALLLTERSDATRQIPDNSVALAVTSPPFLNNVDYVTDNWLRCWFLGLDMSKAAITQLSSLDQWQEYMQKVFVELRRVLRPGGHVAFEVGEIRKGEVRLENNVLAAGSAAGLTPFCVMINQQDFTKTANCWGVDNNDAGTNTNRIVLFKKE